MHVAQLSLVFAKADFKLRNEGTYLGVLWYILNPLALFAILLLVFSRIVGDAIAQYPLYLLLGLIMFNMFRQITTEATKVLYNNRQLIRSIAFEYRSLVMAITIRVLFSHIFEMLIFTVIASFFGISFIGFLYYPILLIFFLTFTYGVALLLASISVYFLDLENIWTAFSQVLWFATPIFYMLTDNSILSFFNSANPLYHFISASRELVIYGIVPDMNAIIFIITVSLLTVLIGETVFSKVTPEFAERF